MMRWSRPLAVAALALALVSAVVLGLLIFDLARDRQAGLWGRAFVVFTGLAALAAALMVLEDVRRHGMKLSVTLRPQVIAGVYAAVFGAAGVMSMVLSLLPPRYAVESVVAGIDRKTDALVKLSRRPADPPPRVLTRIAGIWGEKAPRCGVTYRFAVTGRALRITSDRRPAGAAVWQTVATIRPFEAGRGDVMYTEADGDAATFTYSTNGVDEGLRWDFPKRPPLDLVRCPAA
jgi:hypothetical protein